MKRLGIKYRTAAGEHAVDLAFVDWMAWEKHSGKSAVKGPDTLTDIGYLAWSAERRRGEKRTFDQWAADLIGFPETEVVADEDPTQPGA